MGKEFASAAARWLHLEADLVRPEIVAVADPNPAAHEWFRRHVPTVDQTVGDYREVLARDDIDGVYVAVPHHLHEPVYSDVIRAGKALMGEKPFGIDRAAADGILAARGERPDVFVRCTSQFPFFPPVVRMMEWAQAGEYGEVFEVRAAFNHTSDLNPTKPINWKRQIATNGAYGCLGDLGIHVTHVPTRLGWLPKNVRAVLSNIVRQRPDATGNLVPCETWDNATLLTETKAGFPMVLETKRISPGDTNSWNLAIYGTRMSAEFSTRHPKTLRVLRTDRPDFGWEAIELGQGSAFPSITGKIFEFGFSDAILQMWAAYMAEWTGSPLHRALLGCVTPAEAYVSHQLFSAALTSQANGTTEPVA